jgi:sugar lactone lactonase YvrE
MFARLSRANVLLTSLLFFCILGWSGVALGGWVQRYNGPANGEDFPCAMAVDMAGNVYVAGYSDRGTWGLDYATIKYDTNGNQEWVKRYYCGPPFGGGRLLIPIAIAVDNAGNAYVTGSSGGGASGFDYVTIKYDTNGNRKWVRRYNGPGNSDDYPHAIAVDKAGNVYVTGFSDGGTTRVDWATIKYDTNGNRKWVKRYDQGHGQDVARAIAVDKDGNVYVSGTTSGEFATIKYDTNGNQKWMAHYKPANGLAGASAIAVDRAGNVYVTGSSVRVASFNMVTDYATIKYDTNGNQKWVKQYNGPAYGNDSATAVVVDMAGSVYVTGYSAGRISDFDYATIKYETNGNQKWLKRYNEGYVPSGIAVDKSGNVYVTGSSNDYASDYVTIMYDTNGEQKWVKRYDGPAGGNDSASAIAVDKAGNVYVTGSSDGGASGSDYATIKLSP